MDSKIWVIEHNLNRLPVIDVYVDNVNVVPWKTTVISQNVIQLEFITACSGMSILY
jgi:hypothetical protein